MKKPQLRAGTPKSEARPRAAGARRNLSETERILVVALYGVPLVERGLLEETLGPVDRYVLVDERDRLVPDILIADKRNIAAMERAREMSRRTGGRPLIAITRAGDTRDRWTLPRPLTAARVLSQLAQVQSEMRAQRRAEPAIPGRHGPRTISREPEPAAAVDAPALRSLRALVVDDSDLGRHQVVDALERCGVQSDIAANRDEGLAMAAGNRYDLLLLDASVGGTDGVRIYRDLAVKRGGLEVPVVMLTGRRKGYDAMRAKLWGCEATLTKPVQAVEIRQLLDNLSFDPDSSAPAA